MRTRRHRTYVSYEFKIDTSVYAHAAASHPCPMQANTIR